MKTFLFDFELPESRIAVQPVEPRDSARMLVVQAPSLTLPRKREREQEHPLSPKGGGLGRGPFEDRMIRELASFLRPGDVMVFNDTRVIPARLYGKRGIASVQILLHKKLQDTTWQCFAKPAKKLETGDHIIFAWDLHAHVIKKLRSGEVVVRFNCSPDELPKKLAQHGHMPLPPYIKREDNAADKSQYQTIYAAHDGSVAAPTAGLHFTPELLASIDAAGVKRVHVTLHVGGGTFLPVKVEDTSEHVMHSEYAVVTEEAARAINEARAKGGRIIAVGTTSLRTLESAADDEGMAQAFSGETDIFITPGYRFKTADMLLTNFHLPRSTLFMLVSAFCGLDKMKAAYAHAIAHDYRFYSYGDACLLYKDGHDA